MESFLGYYEILLIGQTLVSAGDYSTLFNLVKVNRLCNQMCQPLLNHAKRLSICHKTDERITWYDVFGRKHRTKGPAVIWRTIDRIEYWNHGRLHRRGDQPTITGPNDIQEYWSHDRRHRKGDLPAIMGRNIQIWYIKNLIHRDGDQPAYVTPEVSRWFQHGKLDRGNDQPAVEYSDGHKEWWINGCFTRKT